MNMHGRWRNLLGLLIVLTAPILVSADEWLPGYTNTNGFVRDQLDVQRQDAKTVVGTKVRVVFYGDSITYFWRSNPQIWDDSFSKFHPLNLGIGGDTASNVQYRVEHGAEHGLEPEGLNPQIVVLMCGTNDFTDADTRAAAITSTVGAIFKRWPNCGIILMSITPRGDAGTPTCQAHLDTNPLLVKMVEKQQAKGNSIIYLDLCAQMTPVGKGFTGISSDTVHYTAEGYTIWAKALVPLLKQYLN